MNRHLATLVAALILLAASGCGRSRNATGGASQGASPGTIGTPSAIRGVWITNVDSDVLTSRRKIAEMMDFLAAHNFNVVYPVVWNGGRTLYPSDIMERETGIRIGEAFAGRDPLQDVIVEAHRVGIEVVPWFEYGFADSYAVAKDSPLGPLLSKHPEWKAIGPDGNIVEKNGFRWMNALDPEVQDFVASLVLEVALKYDIDGIQGDDRMPAMPTLGGYDEKTVARYRAEFGIDPPADIKDPQWVQWRADILSDWFAGLRDSVKAVDPTIAVTSSPSYYDWSLYEYLQDSHAWTNRGIVDSIHPQAYRHDVPAYKSIVDDLVSNQFTPEQLPLLAPGILVKIGKYRIPAEDLKQCVAYNRANGIDGEVFFFYPGLREQDDELAAMLLENFYTEPVRLPYRSNREWRPRGTVVSIDDSKTTGAWERHPTVPELRQLPGSAGGGSVSYDANVGRPGVYDVYTWLRTGPQHTQESVYEVRDTGSTSIDQSVRLNTGWNHIGQVALAAGTHQAVVTMSAPETDSARVTFAGPVMLLLNRRETTKAGW